MTSAPAADLLQLKAQFDAWRSHRIGRQRIPESLWAATIALLDHYPLSTIRRELGLNSKQLQRRVEAARQPHRPATPPQDFLELSAAALLTHSTPMAASTSDYTTCRVIMERADGSRLSLSLPVDWSYVTALFNSFIRL